VAFAEAETALVQARLVAQAEDLEAMQRHAAHLLHALEPSLAPDGPGLGYGVTRAVAAVMGDLSAMAAADRRADVTRATTDALVAARNVQQWVAALAAAAQQVARATSPVEARQGAPALVPLARQILEGVDANRDGRVAAVPGEGGLLALRRSLVLLYVAREGAAPPRLREATR
jgi:hypothetical protein